jgi:hypothetical protein
MRDFDLERQERHAERERLLGDRQFKVGGETFTYKANVSYDVLRALTSDDDLSGSAYINAIEMCCLEMIEDEGDSHERFLALSKRKDDPITLEDLQTVFQGIVEEAFKRPTEASSPSGAGRETTGEQSTENSSTEQAVASAA